MEHLTVDEMIDFVSFNDLSKETMKVVSKVNSHLFDCAECRRKVRAFQTVYDELLAMGKKKHFSSILKEKARQLKKRETEILRDQAAAAFEDELKTDGETNYLQNSK